MSDHENYYSTDSDSIDDLSKVSVLITKQLKDNFYPLKNTWILYDHTKSDSETYEASTRKVCEFGDVVKFWQIFNNYPAPSKLFNNGIVRPIMKCTYEPLGEEERKEISSLSVFKYGILPKWEDPSNVLGGEVSKRKFNKKDTLKELDSNWFDLLMACVGNMMDKSITGIRVVDSSASKRNEHTGMTEFKLLYRIELWFDSIGKKQVIEDQFKKYMNIDDPKAIYYKEHKI